ncbi:hypothetical protein Pmani_023922 [Petrolisthes manimaculis]|uniref:Ig-like domain-containing protein n=1 Tax=Petrolisthes manimaculis TaxID=1843537 RepID=A0AAE1TZU1_9EUCA|nr:hypothetical protein Pmani_023922 [Petrolisthes manimaculis]
MFSLTTVVAGVPSQQRQARQTAEAENQETIEGNTEHPKVTYSKQTVAALGDRVKIDCSVEGVDVSGVNEFSVSWSKIDVDKPTNSFPISTNERVVLFSDKYEVDHPQESQRFSLIIKEMADEETGMYRCTVNFGENQKINADVNVHLQQAPFFTDDFTKTLTVTVGDSISIDCQPGGHPRPEVYWERLNDELPFYGGKFFKSNQLDIPLIEVDHKGHYVCYADNGIGEPATSNVILEVQYPPEINLPVPRVFTEANEPAMMECDVMGYPIPDVTWYKDEAAILGSPNLKTKTEEMVGGQTGVKSSLSVSHVTAEDLGQYTCKASNVIGTSVKSIVLNTKSPPLIVKQSRNEVWYDLEKSGLRDTLPVVIECEADGFPTPTYRWTKNGEPLRWEADNHLSLEDNTGNLLITDPTLKDNGMYQCFAFNDLGTASSDPVYLINVTRIQFSNDDDPSDTYHLEAELGRPYKMSCPQATGYPTPELSWVKAIQHVDKMELEFVKEERVVADPEGSLWFTHITYDDDTKKNGFEYICMASTPFEPYDFSIASIIHLSVVDPADGAHNLREESLNVESFPMFTSGERVTIRAGGESLLWCIYGGEPSPDVSWRRSDGTQLDETRFSTKNYGRTLVIKETHVDDGGIYECVASNNVGEAKMNAISVSVEQPPTFSENMTSQTVSEGTTVTFSCQANSTVNVTYTWTFNGRVITSQNPQHRELDGSRLTIKDASFTDMGNYACNATSTLGYVYGQAALTVLANKQYGIRQSCAEMEVLQQEVTDLRSTVDKLQLILASNHNITYAALLALSDKLSILNLSQTKPKTTTTTRCQQGGSSLYSRHLNPILRLFTQGVGVSANQKMYEKDDRHSSHHKYCMTVPRTVWPSSPESG